MGSLHGLPDRLAQVIEDLQADSELGSLSEVEISQSVRRVFHALGWDPDNRREVKQEYVVGSRRVDYALFIGGTEQVFVEVKKGGELLEQHQEQLLDYAFKEGIKLAVLTNGATWWFYLPLQSGNWEQRKFTAVHLDEQDKAEIVKVLADVLSKEKVSDGSAFDNAERLYDQTQRQSRISETMPKAWNQLIDESDELIVARLAEKTGELCQDEPGENEVKAFLSTHRQNIQIHLTAASPKPNLASGNPQKRRGKKSWTRLAVTMHDGTTVDDKVAANTFVEVIRLLGIQRVKDLNMKINNGRDLISTSEASEQQQRELDGHHINVTTSTQVKKDLLEYIASGLDVSLKVEIIPK